MDRTTVALSENPLVLVVSLFESDSAVRADSMSVEFSIYNTELTYQ